MKMITTSLSKPAQLGLTAASGALFGGITLGTVSGALSSSIGALVFPSKFTPIQKITAAIAFSAIKLTAQSYLVDQPIIASCLGLLPIISLRPQAVTEIGLTAGSGIIGSYGIPMIAGIASAQFDQLTLALLGVEILGSAIAGTFLPSLVLKGQRTPLEKYKAIPYTATLLAVGAMIVQHLRSQHHPYLHVGLLAAVASVGVLIRTRSILFHRQAKASATAAGHTAASQEYDAQLKKFRQEAAARFKEQAPSRANVGDMPDSNSSLKRLNTGLVHTVKDLRHELAEFKKLGDALELESRK